MTNNASAVYGVELIVTRGSAQGFDAIVRDAGDLAQIVYRLVYELPKV